jgi:hypothetical protein
VPGLPTEFLSAAVRVEAGESAKGAANCVGREGGVVVVMGVGVGGCRAQG